MGAGNVKAAYVHWGDLPGGPFRLLVYMALRTKDGDRNPQFWGGREDLAFGLGRHIPEGTDEASRHEREKAFKAVKLAIGALLKVGAIRTVERAKPGRNAVYEINLSPIRGKETGPRPPVDDPEMGPGNRDPKPVENLPVSVGNPVDNSGMGPGSRDPYGSRFSGGMGPGKRAEWVPENGGMGPENRAPKEEKDESGLSEGEDGSGFPASSPPVDNTGPTKNDHDATAGPTFDYRAACEYLLTIPGDRQADAEHRATEALAPGTPRDQILIRAATIAHADANGIPA